MKSRITIGVRGYRVPTEGYRVPTVDYRVPTQGYRPTQVWLFHENIKSRKTMLRKWINEYKGSPKFNLIVYMI